jgi:mercuric reductase
VACLADSKTLIRAAETLHNARVAARFAGIAAEAAVNDWRATVRQKDELVRGLRQAKYLDLLPAYNGITYYEGPGHLVDGGVEVDGERIAADKIIITTGARPAVPAIPSVKTVPYLTSTTALELEELPTSLLVIGGGYVGAELAQMFARTGVSVTLACRSRLLPTAQPEIRDIFVVRGSVSFQVLPIRASKAGVTLTIRCDPPKTPKRPQLVDPPRFLY